MSKARSSASSTIPLLRKGGGGSIINMSSICGLVGHKYTTEAYTVTKGALTLMTKAIGVRYAKDNIRCNSIHPSTVDTPLVQILFQDPKRKEERLGEVPLGRLATDLDVRQRGVVPRLRRSVLPQRRGAAGRRRADAY